MIPVIALKYITCAIYESVVCESKTVHKVHIIIHPCIYEVGAAVVQSRNERFCAVE